MSEEQVKNETPITETPVAEAPAVAPAATEAPAQTDAEIDQYLNQELNKESTAPVEPKVDVEELVSKRVKSELSKIKTNLDNAYAERDQYKSQVDEINKAKQRAEIEALEKAGKHTEILKMEMNEIKSELDNYKKRNTELSRDNVVRSQLSGLEFRNEKAAAMAHADIIATLKQDSSGNWVHESGTSVADAIADYAKNESNSFMFKVKENVGTAVVAPAKPVTKAPVAPTKPVNEMSQDELLRALESGAVTAPGTWNQ